MALSADVILRTALRLVDTQSLQALTMRRLAAELGVAPMSLYGHVPNKEELLSGLMDTAVAEMAFPDPALDPWDVVRSLVREFRRVALLHPNLIPRLTVRPPGGPAELRILEAALEALGRAGLDAAEGARAYRLLASFAIGFVSLESGGYFSPIDAVAGGPHASAADRPSVPRLVEAAPFLAAWDRDAEFEAGMAVIVDHLARSARRGPGR